VTRHRARQGFVKARVAQTNQIRAFWPSLALPKGARAIEERLPTILQIADDELPLRLRQLLARLLEQRAICDTKLTISKRRSVFGGDPERLNNLEISQIRRASRGISPPDQV
jgi:hypothetical protein